MAPLNFDPYKVLELEKGCSEKDIQKAYKKQCLKWHPDKNRGNEEEAQKKFILAQEAFEFLYDKEKRVEYDRKEESERIRKQKDSERLAKADSARRAHIEKLLEREKKAESHQKKEELTPSQQEAKRKREEKNIKASFEALRKQLEKEAAEELHAQQERIKKAMLNENSNLKESKDDDEVLSYPQLRVRWKPGKHDSSEDYDEKSLRNIYEKYGKIATMSSISSKKSRKICLIEFEPDPCPDMEAASVSGLDPPIEGKWLEPPMAHGQSRKRHSETQDSTNNSNPATGNASHIDYTSMSFDDLQAQLFGGMSSTKETKKPKRWHEDDDDCQVID